MECSADETGGQCPVRFHLGQNARRVEAVLDRWYGPRDTYFKVLADDGKIYILRNDESQPDEERWSLEAFADPARRNPGD